MGEMMLEICLVIQAGKADSSAAKQLKRCSLRKPHTGQQPRSWMSDWLYLAVWALSNSDSSELKAEHAFSSL